MKIHVIYIICNWLEVIYKLQNIQKITIIQIHMQVNIKSLKRIYIIFNYSNVHVIF